MKKYILSFLLLSSVLTAADSEIKVRLEPYDNLSQSDKIFFLVPLPKGLLLGTEDIMLDFPKLKLFAKSKVISRWEDKSVKILELSFKGLEGRPLLEGKIIWGVYEKERKEAEEKERVEEEELLRKLPPDKLPGWQKEKLKKTLGKLDAFARPADYKVKMLAIFPIKWYANSKVWGETVFSSDNFKWHGFENKFEAAYEDNIATGKRVKELEASYYDVAHVLFQMYLRSGEKKYLYAGHKEAKRYIEEEIFKEGQYRGQHIKAKGLPIPPKGLTLLYLEGLLDDYILTGDKSSLEWAKIMGEQLLQNMKESDLKINEATNGWPLVQLLALYNITEDLRFLNKAKKIAETAIGWQDASGGWKRVYENKEECPHGHKGGSPYMTAVLCEGLIKYHLLTGDKKAEKALIKAADWLLNEAYMQNQKTFRYIQCPTSTAPGTYSLNPIYIEMLGYATYLSKDEKYRTVAVEVFNEALATKNYANRVWEFAQCFRGSSQGLYWLYKDYSENIRTKLEKMSRELTTEVK